MTPRILCLSNLFCCSNVFSKPHITFEALKGSVVVQKIKNKWQQQHSL